MLLTTVLALPPGSTIRLRLEGSSEEQWDVTSKVGTTSGNGWVRFKLSLRRSGNIVRDITLDGGTLVEVIPSRVAPISPGQPSHLPIDFRELLLQFMGSLTLAEDLEAVRATMRLALQKAGVMVDWDDVDDLRRGLAMVAVTTLDGGSLGEGA